MYSIKSFAYNSPEYQQSLRLRYRILRRPLGITIVGGLIVSQVLTLFTTPVVYLFFDKIGRKYLHTQEADEEMRRHELEDHAPATVAGD